MCPGEAHQVPPARCVGESREACSPLPAVGRLVPASEGATGVERGRELKGKAVS